MVAAVKVRVSLHGDVHRYRRGRPDPFEEELDDGATVAALVERIGIDPAMTITVGLNGELGRREAVLHDGDEVLILTPMEGG
ncbi:MAG TPA: MoaD/ThiS family protein [Chloroflexota bacterium]|nr:MoaD/ThiS family protein [Chloroflexota bacterium]